MAPGAWAPTAPARITGPVSGLTRCLNLSSGRGDAPSRAALMPLRSGSDTSVEPPHSITVAGAASESRDGQCPSAHTDFPRPDPALRRKAGTPSERRTLSVGLTVAKYFSGNNKMGSCATCRYVVL